MRSSLYFSLILSSNSASCPSYLELQSEWPVFNRKLSFFRGNFRFFLHFQQKIREN